MFIRVKDSNFIYEFSNGMDLVIITARNDSSNSSIVKVGGKWFSSGMEVTKEDIEHLYESLTK